jgi:hypothetical protein
MYVWLLILIGVAGYSRCLFLQFENALPSHDARGRTVPKISTQPVLVFNHRRMTAIASSAQPDVGGAGRARRLVLRSRWRAWPAVRPAAIPRVGSPCRRQCPPVSSRRPQCNCMPLV